MDTETGFIIIAVLAIIVRTAMSAYRKRWGCRLWIHQWEDAFPATYSHLECRKCGKRSIPSKNFHPGAPVDLHWLETGERYVMGLPEQPERSVD